MSWMKDEQTRLGKEAEKRLGDKDIRPLIKLDEGVVTVSVDLKEEPKIVETKFGMRKVVNTVEPEGKCLMMSGYLYELFIKAVADKNGVVRLNFVRTGTGKETKYVVKAVG